ncbi:hypothetical protein Q9L58_005584 [Maublancomyces gigas]|uniref:Uncharacterized protein n=1 Tax=Discina gigas TaxID=1032678 RepID=A0ABR3GHX3_9PEZI
MPIHKDPETENPLIVDFRVAPSPPSLLLLPTPPASEFSPRLKQVNPAHATAMYEDCLFYAPSKSTLWRSVPTTPTRRRCAPLSKVKNPGVFFRNMSREDFTDWQELYLDLNKNGKARLHVELNIL